MKRNPGIAFISLAVVMLLTVPYIPHHHHNGAICISAEHCHDYASDGGRHANHDGDNSLCIEDEEYLVSNADSLHDSLNPHFHPILATGLNPVVNGEIVPKHFHTCGYDAMARYHRADIARARALRAPPCPFA